MNENDPKLRISIEDSLTNFVYLLRVQGDVLDVNGNRGV